MGTWLAEKKKARANDKEALRAYRKQYYEANKEKQKARVRRYKKTARARELYNANRASNVVGRLWNSTRGTAKQKGLEHNIAKEDIIIPVTCPLLGIPIDCSIGKGKLREGPSVDRIDSSKGYVKGNVQVISNMANAMKQEASIEQLLIFARNIVKIYSTDSQTVTR